MQGASCNQLGCAPSTNVTASSAVASSPTDRHPPGGFAVLHGQTSGPTCHLPAASCLSGLQACKEPCSCSLLPHRTAQCSTLYSGCTLHTHQKLCCRTTLPACAAGSAGQLDKQKAAACPALPQDHGGRLVMHECVPHAPCCTQRTHAATGTASRSEWTSM